MVKHKTITAGHKEQISQVNDFSAFLNRRRCKNLGPLKLFLSVHLHDWCLRAGVSKHRVLLVSPLLHSPQVHCGWAMVVPNGLILVELECQATILFLYSLKLEVGTKMEDFIW